MSNVVTFRLDGEDRLLVFNTKNDVAFRLAKTLRGETGDLAWLDNATLNRVGTITRYLASVNTQFNPVFGLSNFLRDFQESSSGKCHVYARGKPRRLTGRSFQRRSRIGART